MLYKCTVFKDENFFQKLQSVLAARYIKVSMVVVVFQRLEKARQFPVRVNLATSLVGFVFCISNMF